MTARGSFKPKEALKRKSKAEHMAAAAFLESEAFMGRTAAFKGKNPSIHGNRSIH